MWTSSRRRWVVESNDTRGADGTWRDSSTGSSTVVSLTGGDEDDNARWAVSYLVGDSQDNLAADRGNTDNDGDEDSIFGGVIWCSRSSRGSGRVNNWDVLVDSRHVSVVKSSWELWVRTGNWNKDDVDRFSRSYELTNSLVENTVALGEESVECEASKKVKIICSPVAVELDVEDIGGSINSDLSYYASRVVSDWKRGIESIKLAWYGEINTEVCRKTFKVLHVDRDSDNVTL